MSADLIAQVRAAIQCMFTGPVNGNGNAKAANEFLVSIQNGPHAWDVARTLLDVSMPLAEQFFASTTLYSKITSRDGLDVEEDLTVAMQLRDYLTALVADTTPRPSNVQQKLAQCLAALAIRIMPDHWRNMVPELMTAVQGAPSAQQTRYLAVLAALPIECKAKYVSSKQQQAVNGLLREHIDNVLAMLHVFVVTDDEEVSRAGIVAIGDWIELGIPMSTLYGGPLLHALLQKMFVCEPLRQWCARVLIEAFDIPVLTDDGAQSISSLCELFHAHTHILDGMIASDDPDLVWVAKVYVHFGDNHARFLSSVPTLPWTVELQQQILKLTGNEDLDVAEATFPFWESLADAIAETPEKIETYKTIFEWLLEALRQRVMRKSIALSEIDAELDEHRDAVGATVTCIVPILGTKALGILTPPVIAVCDPANAQDVSAITNAEAALILACDLSSHFGVGAHPELLRLLELLTSLPAVPVITQAAVQLIGACARWFQSVPDLVPVAAGLVLPCLTQPQLFAVASRSLRDLATHCASTLNPQIDAIFSQAGQVFSTPSLQPSNSDHRAITEALAFLVASLPSSRQGDYLGAVLSSVTDVMTRLAEQSMNPTPKVIEDTVDILHTLTRVIDVLDNSGDYDPFADSGDDEPASAQPSSNAVQRVAGQVWPLLHQFLTAYAVKDASVVSSLCNVYTECVKSCNKTEGGDMLVSLLDTLSDAYVQTGITSVLDVCVVTVQNQGARADLAPAVEACTRRVTQHTFASIGQNMQDHPDITGVFFRFIVQVMRRCPRALLTSQDETNAVIHMCNTALALPERPTLAAALLLLSEFAVLRNWDPEVEAVIAAAIRPVIPAIVQGVLRGLGGGQQDASVPHLTDLLYLLVVNRPGDAREALLRGVAELAREEPEIGKKLLASSGNKRIFSRHVLAFRQIATVK